MSENETKLKVKDLPESEKKALLEEMAAAGLRGALTEYSAEKAKLKVEEWKKSQQGENDGENDGEQPPADDKNDGENKDEQNGKDDEQNGQDDEQNGQNDEQKAENVNKEPEKVNKPKKQEKQLICYVCYGLVENGVCKKCGQKFKK